MKISFGYFVIIAAFSCSFDIFTHHDETCLAICAWDIIAATNKKTVLHILLIDTLPSWDMYTTEFFVVRIFTISYFSFWYTRLHCQNWAPIHLFIWIFLFSRWLLVQLIFHFPCGHCIFKACGNYFNDTVRVRGLQIRNQFRYLNHFRTFAK